MTLQLEVLLLILILDIDLPRRDTRYQITFRVTVRTRYNVFQGRKVFSLEGCKRVVLRSEEKSFLGKTKYFSTKKKSFPQGRKKFSLVLKRTHYLQSTVKTLATKLRMDFFLFFFVNDRQCQHVGKINSFSNF